MLADWDPRLISPDRALMLAGDWPVYATYELAELSQFGTETDPGQPDQWQINLRCRRCEQSCGLLSDATGPYQTNVGDLLSGVLRHLVMAHDLSLSAGGSPS